MPRSRNGSKFCLKCGVKQEIRQNTKNRGNGQGSVYQLPNKKWIAVKVVGYQREDGKLRKITRSKSGFRTKKTPGLPSQLEAAPAQRPTTWAQLYEVWKPTHRPASPH